MNQIETVEIIDAEIIPTAHRPFARHNDSLRSIVASICIFLSIATMITAPVVGVVAIVAITTHEAE